MLAKRLSSITPSLTLGISTRVKELKANGKNIVDLSIGEPDFFTPQRAKDAGIKAIENNLTKYDAASGVLKLREAVCKKLKEENNLDYTPDQIVVSSGAKHSITNSLIALLDPLDEVIIPTPYWVSYPEMVKLVGGVPIIVETSKENSFKITPNEFKSAISPKTKAIIITNPSNPTGAVFSKEELEKLISVAIEHNIYIISDEIYERIIYDGVYTSIATLSKEAYDKTIIINGLAKSSSMTGWRIGYTASNKEIAKAMGMIQGHLVSHPSTISQYAALEAILSCQEDTKAMLDVYSKRREIIIGKFNQINDLAIIKPQGAFYIFIDISKLKQKLGYPESLSLKVCDNLLVEKSVAFVPGIAFGNDDFIRMSYAASIEDITYGLDMLKEYVEEVMSR
jgi:aspartate aminotransferase